MHTYKFMYFLNENNPKRKKTEAKSFLHSRNINKINYVVLGKKYVYEEKRIVVPWREQWDGTEFS